MIIKAEELREFIIQETAKAIEEVEEANRIHAPSPMPPMPKDDTQKKDKKRKAKSRDVDHEDKVSGNMDDFGKIIEKLSQIIREEVAAAINEIDEKDKHAGHGYYMSRSERERERNAGLRATERPRKIKYSKISSGGAAIIDKAVAAFLEKMNDPEGGEWPQTWAGGGRVYLGQEEGYRDRTPEEIDQMRKRFDDAREKAGRNPFKPEHIAIDINQSGSSAWGGEGANKYPSLSAWVNKAIIYPLSEKFGMDTVDFGEFLVSYINGDVEVV
jgi:hypothetical protein